MTVDPHDWQGNTGWSQYLCEQFLRSTIGLFLLGVVVFAVGAAAEALTVSGEALTDELAGSAFRVEAQLPCVSDGYELRDGHAATPFGRSLASSTSSNAASGAYPALFAAPITLICPDSEV